VYINIYKMLSEIVVNLAKCLLNNISLMHFIKVYINNNSSKIVYKIIISIKYCFIIQLEYWVLLCTHLEGQEIESNYL